MWRPPTTIALAGACVQDQSSEADSRHTTDRRSERRRIVDVACQVPADVCHVAASRGRRVPASLRVVDAQRRPAATADRRPFGRERSPGRPARPRRQHGRRRLLRPQCRLGAHVDDCRCSRGRVPVLSGKELRRCDLLVQDASAIHGSSWSAQSQHTALRVASTTVYQC